jgi:tripartite-type tricarboxylate transporter receptor subunit TctC
MKTRLPIVAATALTLSAALTAPASAQSVAEFYAGRNLSVIVGSSAGGGYDTQARLMARHLGKHIPGNPTIVVHNMPGAGSLTATNFMYNAAAKDGGTIALVQRGMLLLKHFNPAGVRFELDKFGWIGSLNSETGLAVAWYTAPHRTFQDLRDKELIVGGITGADPEISARLYNSLLGTKFKVIAGYPGTMEIGLAMERGELFGSADWSWSSLKKAKPDWLRDRKVILLLQGALRKEPELPQVPSALDFARNEADRKVLQLYFTQKVVARPVIAPPGIPADRLAALRAAFKALAQDREFLADGERSQLEIAPLAAEEVDKNVALIASSPPDIAERLAKAFGGTGR